MIDFTVMEVPAETLPLFEENPLRVQELKGRV
jgi:hypothetical protein